MSEDPKKSRLAIWAEENPTGTVSRKRLAHELDGYLDAVCKTLAEVGAVTGALQRRNDTLEAKVAALETKLARIEASASRTYSHVLRYAPGDKVQFDEKVFEAVRAVRRGEQPEASAAWRLAA